MPDTAGNGHVARQTALVIGLAIAGIVAYSGWLGWDEEYQTDPVTGVRSGPYEAWQVQGAVITLIVVAVIAGLVRRTPTAVVVVPVAFTLAWSWQAQDDDTGLWLVGAIMIFIGLVIGVWVVAGSATWLRDAAAAHRPT